QRCKELGKQLSGDYEGKIPVVIGLLRGSVPFLAELIKNMTIDIELDFIYMSSYTGAKSCGETTTFFNLKTDIKDRDVIVIDDIIDTGLTMTDVYCDLKFKGAKSIKIVTLLDKPQRNDYTGIKPDYYGFEAPICFVVGFGLDYNGLYRNLPYIAALKEEYIL
ncbi:MAG: hypoxanthine phosphoribosyltransferase, partial [Clostridia bacterium]